MMDGYGGYGMGMGWWWIIGLIFLVVVVWIVLKVAGQNKNPGTAKSALDILKERYARGEIDKEEYEERKKKLAE